MDRELMTRQVEYSRFTQLAPRALLNTESVIGWFADVLAGLAGLDDCTSILLCPRMNETERVTFVPHSLSSPFADKVRALAILLHNRGTQS